MASNIEEIATHMTYEGYRVERSGDKAVFTAERRDSLSITFLNTKPVPVVYFFSKITGIKSSPELAILLNKINSKLLIWKTYYQEENASCSVYIAAIYAGTYERQTFRDFLEAMHADMATFVREAAGKL